MKELTKLFPYSITKFICNERKILPTKHFNFIQEDETIAPSILVHQYMFQMFMQSSDAKKSIAIKLSWKFALKQCEWMNTENIYTLLFILLCNIISTHMTMKNANWNWYVEAYFLCSSWPARRLEARKESNKFSPISQTWSHKWAKFEARFSRANSSKLNEFVFVFLLHNRIRTNVMTLEINCCFYSIIEINIQHGDSDSKVVSSLFGSQEHKICNLFYSGIRSNVNVPSYKKINLNYELEEAF